MTVTLARPAVARAAGYRSGSGGRPATEAAASAFRTSKLTPRCCRGGYSCAGPPTGRRRQGCCACPARRRSRNRPLFEGRNAEGVVRAIDNPTLLDAPRREEERGPESSAPSSASRPAGSGSAGSTSDGARTPTWPIGHMSHGEDPARHKMQLVPLIASALLTCDASRPAHFVFTGRSRNGGRWCSSRCGRRTPERSRASG